MTGYPYKFVEDENGVPQLAQIGQHGKVSGFVSAQIEIWKDPPRLYPVFLDSCETFENRLTFQGDQTASPRWSSRNWLLGHAKNVYYTGSPHYLLYLVETGEKLLFWKSTYIYPKGDRGLVQIDPLPAWVESRRFLWPGDDDLAVLDPFTGKIRLLSSKQERRP